MKSLFFLPYLILGISVPLHAQALKPFADQIQKTYDQAQDLSLHFVQETYVAVLEREVKKQGSGQFKKPGKLRIDYAGENGRQYLSNGKTLWIFQKGDAQAQTVSLSDQEFPAEALSFLGGLGNLQRDFSVEEVDEKKWKSLNREKNGLRWLELTPLQKRSTIQSLVMGFDIGSALAKEIYLFTESGNLSHYTISEIKMNSGLSDTIFEFKK